MNAGLVVAFVTLAALGGLIRWQATRWNDRPIPSGTLAVNIVASLAAGLAAGVSTEVATVLVVAFLGATSTFSTLVGELYDRFTDGRRPAACAYLALTVVGGIGAASIGLALAS